MDNIGQLQQMMEPDPLALQRALAERDKQMQKMYGAQGMAQGNYGAAGGIGVLGNLIGGLLARRNEKRADAANQEFMSQNHTYNRELAQFKAQQEQQQAEAARKLQLEDDARKHGYSLEEIGARGQNSMATTLAQIQATDARQEDQQSFTAQQAAAQLANKPQDFSQGDALRKELNTQTSDFAALNKSFGKIEKAYNRPSPANDISMLFGIMKMMDPRSTVREGEIATAQNAAGIDERVVGYYNSLKTGAKLTPAQREDFYKTASGLYQSGAENYQKTYGEYASLAQRQGLNPDDIFIKRDVKEFEKAEKQQQNLAPDTMSDDDLMKAIMAAQK